MVRYFIIISLLLSLGSACWAGDVRIVLETEALDAAGAPLADGTYWAVFHVYADPAGGQPEWTESVEAMVSGGKLRAELGRETALDLDWSRQHYVAVAPAGGSESGMRVPLTRPDAMTEAAVSSSSGRAYVVADGPLYEPVVSACDESTHPGGNWGANIGSFEGVIAYSNGSDTGSWSSLEPYCQDGYEYQCVEYVRRFYRLHLGMNTTWYGNGNQFYDNGPGWGLERYPNNGTTLPQPDDIMCFDYGSWGHVAIVTSVTSTKVNVIQQNVSSTTGFGSLNITNGIVYGSSCQGWLRKPGNGADPTAPVISSVTTSGITASSATVTWNTDDYSTSRVEYGLTASYGMNSSEDSTLVNAHGVYLSGLSPNTLYHYRVKSTNNSGLTSYSSDNTFATAVADAGQPVVTVTGPTTLTVANNPSDSPTAYYAFRVTDGASNRFVQANGTLGAAPLWQTKAVWGSKTVTGLNPATSYVVDVDAAADATGGRRTSNRYAGIYMNSPGMTVVNKWGSGDTAAGFNGSSHYVSLPGIGPEVDLSGGFTIECWARPSSIEQWSPVIQLTDSSGYPAFVNHVCFDMAASGAMRGEVYQAGGCGSPCAGNYYLSPSLTFTTGVWNHYAMVVSASGTLTFYKNGAPDAGQPLLYMPSAGVARAKVQIGRRDTGAVYYWKGALDDIAIYEYALPASRISAHAAAASAAAYNSAVISDNPAAYWRLGETSGIAAADSKGGYSPSTLRTTSSCTAPAVIAHPSSVTPSVGESVTFTVTASGTAPLAYSWRRNGSAIAGATGSSFVIASVTTADSGAYDCVVSNSCGSATSNSATLAVQSQALTIVSAAKALADGTAVTLCGPVVSRSFGGFCYVEDSSRAAGIRVIAAEGMPAEGAAPCILAQLDTVDGERVLAHALFSGSSSAQVPEALGMNNRSASDPLALGLLVTLWGRASVPPGAVDQFFLTDGSAAPIAVRLHGADLPADGEFVKLTGALGVGPTLHVK